MRLFPVFYPKLFKCHLGAPNAGARERSFILQSGRGAGLATRTPSRHLYQTKRSGPWRTRVLDRGIVLVARQFDTRSPFARYLRRAGTRQRVANFPRFILAAPPPSANPSLPLSARFVMQLYSSRVRDCVRCMRFVTTPRSFVLLY